MSVETANKPTGSFTTYLKEMKETGQVLRWIWTDLIGAEGRRWSYIMAGTIIVMTLLFALQPLIFSWVVNSIREEKMQYLMAATLALVSAAVLHHGVSIVQELLREYAWNRMLFHLQMRINELFYEKSLGQHAEEEGSSLSFTSIDRAKSRVEMVQQMLLFDTGSMILGVFFSYVLLWTLSWQIGLVVTGLMVVYVLWSLYLNYHVSKGTDHIEREFRAYGRQLIERWEKIVRVKTTGKSRSEHERLAGWFDGILLADRRFWFWFIRQAGIRDTIMLIARLGIIGYGAYLVFEGEWQVGTLIPLYAWITEVSQNLWFIGHAERRLTQQVPYIRSMRNALMLPPSFQEAAGETLEVPAGIRLDFDRVGLAYGTADAQEILRDISFCITPGEKVALIGPSGAGKTTIMKLALRYLDPTSGEIRINGQKLTEIRHASWMDQVGYIAQQPHVFDGTIRYNLTFGLSSEEENRIPDEEIWDLMRLLQIDFGKRLIHGLDTRVGKDGMKLSGGQAQRLMIGAAVIKRPSFMIIDEATSSLDSTTERGVQAGLEKVLTDSVGALIIAHRLDTVRAICNRFLVLRPLEEVTEGSSQVEAEAGTFEELYAISPTFRRLADDQHLAL